MKGSSTKPETFSCSVSRQAGTGGRIPANPMVNPATGPTDSITKPTRRQFLVNCSALAVTASITPVAFGSPLRGREAPLESIGPADFARQLNSAFVVRPAQGVPIELALVEFRPLPNSKRTSPNAEDAQNEKFALLFRGTPASPLAQNSYPFEHQRLGRFVMFIVPIGCMDQSHCYYEAIFNRPARASQTRNAPNQAR